MELETLSTLTKNCPVRVKDPVLGPPKENSDLVENNPRLNRRVRLLTDNIARKPSGSREVVIAQGLWQYEDHL